MPTNELEDETSPLLPSAPKNMVIETVERDFIMMCFVWSFGMTCILLPMSYASSVFGTSAGSLFLGLDYTSLSVTSLLFAAPFVEYFGPKMSLGISCLALICYLVCFVLAEIAKNEALRYVIMSFGMCLDGAAGTIGWVAQGVYYSRMSFLYHQKEVLHDNHFCFYTQLAKTLSEYYLICYLVIRIGLG